MYGLPNSGPGDLAATPITDVFAVPEPSTGSLALLGGLSAGLLVLLERRRSKMPHLRKRTHKRKKAALIYRASACLVVSLAFAEARATTVIAPNDLPGSSGNVPASQTYGDTSNLFPLFPGPGNALEYQQVYATSQFSAFAPGGEDITSIVFRVGAEAAARLDHGAFATTIPLIQFTLSTTSALADNLSSMFASNLGADATTVYGIAGAGSPLAISSSGSATGNPAPFDITVQLTTPFHYDPSRGNLLLGVQNYSGAASPTGVELDGTLAAGDAVSRVYNLGNATATAANNSDTAGLVTEFIAAPVPEPSSNILLGFGAVIGIAAWIGQQPRPRQ
jgi:hypothetical protein